MTTSTTPEPAALMTEQKDLFDLDPESEEFDEIDKAYAREQLQWLADRGLCTWSEAVEFSPASSFGPPSTHGLRATTLQ